MVANQQPDLSMESISKAEHLDPATTGDNIAARKVANYYWDGANWQRQGQSILPGKDYDFIDGQQTSSSIETYVYKLGGSSGTTVRTVVITYTDSTKANIDTVVYS